MGDFLGATICITELMLLIAIHAFPVTREIRDAIVNNAIEMWSILKNDKQVDFSVISPLSRVNTDRLLVNPFLRIIIVITSVLLWTSLMNLAKKRNYPSSECPS